MIQAFVTSWDNPTCYPEEAAAQIDVACPVEILYEVHHRPFADQWQRAVDRFYKSKNEIMLWCMGDTRPPLGKMLMMVSDIVDYLGTGEIAMYAPNVDWSSQIYNRSKIPMWRPNVYEVCGTDLLMCAVSRQLLDVAPPITGNSRGWFYDYALTAVANRMGKKVVRDYNYTAKHPQGSIYNMEEAGLSALGWRESLPIDLQNDIAALVAKQAEVCS